MKDLFYSVLKAGIDNWVAMTALQAKVTFVNSISQTVRRMVLNAAMATFIYVASIASLITGLIYGVDFAQKAMETRLMLSPEQISGVFALFFLAMTLLIYNWPKIQRTYSQGGLV